MRHMYSPNDVGGHSREQRWFSPRGAQNLVVGVLPVPVARLLPPTPFALLGAPPLPEVLQGQPSEQVVRVRLVPRLLLHTPRVPVRVFAPGVLVPPPPLESPLGPPPHVDPLRPRLPELVHRRLFGVRPLLRLRVPVVLPLPLEPEQQLKRPELV